jgi:hypothetical protein
VSASDRSLLAPFDRVALDGDPATIYLVTPELHIAYVNPAWSTFAGANGARWEPGEWGVGARIMDAIPEVLRPFYEDLYRRAFARREVVEHDYDCSSPTVYRRFRLRLMPCESGALLVINSPLREAPHAVLPGSTLEALYRDEDGLIRQCSHCRRLRRTSQPPSWEWVPEQVARPAPRTSHVLCHVCTRYYYPPLSEAPSG